MIVYELQGLTKIYPGQTRPANREISLQITEGEIFGLLGDNGAGKSTLVRQMANLTRSTSGEIRFLGRPLGESPLRVPLNVGYMPQDALALNNLTLGEALYFSAHLRGLSRPAARRARDELLALWGIEALRDKTGRQLSGGQRRLMQLAVAMAGSPPVLLLDEPTNDLDPQRRKEVWETLRCLNREKGTTIIFITHDAVEAEKIIRRVGILRAGELVALGRPAELKARIDRQVRLDLFYPPDRPPRLHAGLTAHTPEPGHSLLYLERREAAEALKTLDLDELDDFRLYSATLEDLYLYFANQAEPSP